MFSGVRSRLVLHRHLADVDLRINVGSFVHRFETAIVALVLWLCLLSLRLCILSLRLCILSLWAVAMHIELEPSTNRLYSYMFALHIAIFLSHSGASFQLYLGGPNFFLFFNATGLLKNWKKQHFICSNLTLFIVPVFLFFLFFFFLFFLFFFFLGGGGDGPQPPSNDAPDLIVTTYELLSSSCYRCFFFPFNTSVKRCREHLLTCPQSEVLARAVPNDLTACSLKQTNRSTRRFILRRNIIVKWTTIISDSYKYEIWHSSRKFLYITSEAGAVAPPRKQFWGTRGSVPACC